jgi:uncharacterized Fe-S center protein
VEHCNAGAIRIEGGKAKIDEKKCEGCAMCIAICNNGAIEVPWQGRTTEDLQKRIAQYSKAVLDRFPDPIFINVLEKITEECDCWSTVQTPIMEDVGLLYSGDIVAIDKASLDLVNKFSGGKFENLNQADKGNQTDVAEKLGLGSVRYELVGMDPG